MSAQLPFPAARRMDSLVWNLCHGRCSLRSAVWFAMTGDEQLREKLAKVEALFRQAGSPKERAAAGEAAERLRGRLGSAAGDGGPDTELRFSPPDMWSVRLFVTVCRKHGLRPFRYARRRRTTVMVRARERSVDSVVWAEFSRLHTELQFYFEDVADHLITRAMGSDGDDSTIGRR